MLNKNLHQLLTFFNLSCDYADDVIINDLCLDSRNIKNGDVFIALSGHSYDGCNYIDDAISRGAGCILSDTIDNPSKNIYYIDQLKEKLPELVAWFYPFLKKDKIICTVTGTNGKSSINFFLAQIISRISSSVLHLGTLGNGLFPALSQSSHTTVDIVSLYQFLSKYNYDTAVLEISSHALIQERLGSLPIDIAIFSNLSQDHLDYHKTMENYFCAKKKLFTRDNLRYAIVNIDCMYGARLFKQSSAQHCLSYSLKFSHATLYMPVIKKTPTGFLVECYYQQIYLGHVSIDLLGEFNIANMCAVILTLLACYNYKWSDIKHYIDTQCIKNAPGRLELINNPLDYTIYIDYAHTPDAITNCLQSIKTHFTHKKIYALFGCGGNRDKTKRSLMMKAAQQWADTIFLTEDNNRTETFDDIINDIMATASYNNVHIIPNRQKAIIFALSKLDANTVLVLMGKGHESYIERNHAKIAFNEKEIINCFYKGDR